LKNPYLKQQKNNLTNSDSGHGEGWALVELARRIDAEIKKDPLDKKAFLDIIRLNWRVWTILQTDLSSPESTVPLEIRQNLLNLANFIDKRSVDIISNPTAEQANVLININRNIGAGLMQGAAKQKEEEQKKMSSQVPDASDGSGDIPSNNGSSNAEILKNTVI
jgi:flagellar protein FlaF